jgi:hypothetical protein
MGGKLHTKQKTETLKPRNEQHTFLSAGEAFRLAVVPHSSSSSIVIESQGAEDNVRRIGAYRYKAKWEEPG